MADRFGQLNKELLERRIQEQQTFYESKILEIRNQELLEENLIISRQKSQIEEQSHRLDEMNKNKDKLFSIIGHDLRGPLNSFLAFSHLLINHVDSLSKEEIKKMSAELNDSLANLKILLENLLDWSRSQIGHVDFTPTEFEFSQIIQYNVEALTSLATIKKITIESRLAEPIIVFAHRHSINSVINNVLSNAIKFTPIGGEIAIDGRIDGRYLEVCFHDSGVGMSPHVMANLFQIGSKISTLGTANEKGTGLGLILTKEFIEKNAGSIWVESKEGIGSSFYFTIPLGNYKNESV
jgi:signal transduction histidine kinase